MGPDNAIGKSRGGLSTKINAVVDERGLPIRLVITPGQASDKAPAGALIESLTRTRDLVADRGYDAIALVNAAQNRGDPTPLNAAALNERMACSKA